MLYCLWKVGRAIYELAEGYAEANEARAIDEAEARGEDVAESGEFARRVDFHLLVRSSISP